jgi:hypothetical protein
MRHPGRTDTVLRTILSAAMTATLLTVAGCATGDAGSTRSPGTPSGTRTQQHDQQQDAVMKIPLTVDDTTVEAILDDTTTSREFAALLPITLTDYAGTEKLSDLPRRLSTAEAPAGTDASVGDIAYYAPQGHVMIA